MRSQGGERRILCFIILACLLMLDSIVWAQSSAGLRGHVTDPSGAVVPGATVTAIPASGARTTAVSDNQGNYELKGLTPGTYTITAQAKGFTTSTEQNFQVTAGQVQQFDIALEIQVKQEKIEVQEEGGPTVSTSASDNASSLVLQGKDLDALPDDPDELQQDLEALAGPSAGPNGGQIYIDGFTGGQLPPKSSIREIRINQNPFSSEYDKLGYGRIEIFTKPGTDQYHGQFMLDGNDSAFNSLNPFVTSTPPYHSELFHASIGGPLSRKASFFFNLEGRSIDDANVVNATVLNANFTPTSLIEAIPNPRFRLNLGPRVDYQISKNNTLTVRYQFFHDSQSNDGVGLFSLPSQEYNSLDDEHTLQISDTQVINSNIVNETRFQYVRDNVNQTVQNFGQTLNVLGAFTGGGNSQGNSTDIEDRYEFQNYTSIAHGRHLIKFGARLRDTDDSNQSFSNFNGVLTFSSLTAYENYAMGGNICTIASPAPCGPSQFTIVHGVPGIQVSLFDAGLYAQDDWRMRPNLTLSYGLRFESQNQINDHADWAPRVSLAWGLGRSKGPAPKTVLRAGFGIFYDRFAYNLVEQTERLNGITQLQTITSFDPDTPGVAGTAVVSPTIYQLASGLRTPMNIQSAVGLERQVTARATVALTYLNTHGEHQLFLRNANAPFAGGSRPFGGTDNIYQYDSEGIYRQNQLIANVRVSAGTHLSLFGYYSLNYANSDLGSGASGGAAGGFSGGATATPNFVSNSYDPMADYGRSTFDVRHRGFLGGTISMPYAFRLNPFLLVASGSPFDIITGTDVNGDSVFNDRPGIVSSVKCPVVTTTGTSVCTPLGTFNTVPTAGETIVPINSATGPTLFTLNLRLSKTFGFGRETKGGGAPGGGPGGGGGGGGSRGGGPPGGGLGPGGLSGAGRGMGGIFGGATTDRRYNLTFTVSARNVLNRVNLAPPVGTLSSPSFDQSIALAGGPYSSAGANRRIDLQVLFSF